MVFTLRDSDSLILDLNSHKAGSFCRRIVIFECSGLYLMALSKTLMIASPSQRLSCMSAQCSSDSLQSKISSIPFSAAFGYVRFYCGDDRIHNGKCFLIKLNQTCLQFGYFQQRLQQCFQSVQCTPAADAKFLLLRLTQIVPQQYAKSRYPRLQPGFSADGKCRIPFPLCFPSPLWLPLAAAGYDVRLLQAEISELSCPT